MRVIDLEPVVDSHTETIVDANIGPRIMDKEEWYNGMFQEIPIGIANYEVEEIYIKDNKLRIVVRG